MRVIYAFVAGFIAVLVFHQGMLNILHESGFTPAVPFVLRPTEPFHVPVVWSLAFWGGVWGIVFVGFESIFPKGAGYWLWAIIFGAVALCLVAWFVVAPLKGTPMAAGWKPQAMATGLLVNGAWGLGCALFLRGFSGKRRG
ncbi:MAG TPA: hypothetical protein VLS90_09250 [Thermodesulfobacteriota bacterium]|nr:hypothetical protein [Thermodesulfobacteriota bacterium]